MNAKDKYTAYICKEVAGRSKIIGKVKIKADTKLAKYKKTSYPIDTTKPIFSLGLTNIYLIDVIRGQLQVGSTTEMASPEIVDAIFRREIVRQLVTAQGVVGQLANQWVLVIVVLACGLLGGYLIGNFVPINASTSTTVPVYYPIGV